VSRAGVPAAECRALAWQAYPDHANRLVIGRHALKTRRGGIEAVGLDYADVAGAARHPRTGPAPLRNGTSSPFAAPKVATGNVIARRTPVTVRSMSRSSLGSSSMRSRPISCAADPRQLRNAQDASDQALAGRPPGASTRTSPRPLASGCTSSSVGSVSSPSASTSPACTAPSASSTRTSAPRWSSATRTLS
jgi:hypothetical protein